MRSYLQTESVHVSRTRSSVVHRRRSKNGVVLMLIAGVCVLGSCERELVVGSFTCPPSNTSEAAAGAGGAAGAASVAGPLTVPWGTGFENGFCDYLAVGFCYADSIASYSLVTSPVHSGRFAAAFKVVTSTTSPGSQARCVRQGALPKAAYYGAWFFIPASAKNLDNWNLVHFQGGAVGSTLHGLWDVTLTSQTDGSLHLVVYDFLHTTPHQASNVPAVPIGQWFRIQTYLKRASDNTGEFALYQDGQLAVDVTNTNTDDTDFGQWYVGNLAISLTPPESTVYVDDVTISDTL